MEKKKIHIKILFLLGMFGMWTSWLNAVPGEEKEKKFSSLRKLHNPGEYAFVGRVVADFGVGMRFGTGFLIADRYVLTPAYNLYDRNFKTFAQAVRFTPASTGPGSIQARSVIVDPRWIIGQNEDQIQYSCVGLIQLTQPVTTPSSCIKLLSLGEKEALSDLDIQIIGCIDCKHGFSVFEGVGKVTKFESSKIFYDIDTQLGFGGGPIIIRRQGAVFCIGIHAYGGTESNSGIRFNKDKIRKINSWKQELEKDLASEDEESISGDAHKEHDIKEEQREALKKRRALLVEKVREIDRRIKARKEKELGESSRGDSLVEETKSKRKQAEETVAAHESVIPESRSKKKPANEGAVGGGEGDEGPQLSAEEQYITSILSKVVSLGSAQEKEKAESRLVPNVKKTERKLAKEFKEEATHALKKLSRPYATVLSIDGGGIRGYMPALWLKYIEDETGKHPHELFDFIGGTSIGGILGLGISTPLETNELVQLFTTKARAEIFPQFGVTQTTFKKLRGLIAGHYPAASLEGLLRNYWGERQFGSLKNRVVITSVNAANGRPVLFKSYDDRYQPCKIWEVARATSAAPTYFEAYPIMLPGNSTPINLIDGGLYKNNPTEIMLSEVVSYPASREKNLSPRDVIMISLGTGKVPPSERLAAAGGQLNSAKGAIETIMDACSLGVEKAVKRQLLSNQYLRINPRLANAVELDQATPGNLAVLEETAQGEFETLQTSIDEGEIRKILEMGQDRFFTIH